MGCDGGYSDGDDAYCSVFMGFSGGNILSGVILEGIG